MGEKEYEDLVDSYGEEGRDFIVKQKLRYGGKRGINEGLFARLRRERVEAHYIKKDRREERKREREQREREEKEKEKKKGL